MTMRDDQGGSPDPGEEQRAARRGVGLVAKIGALCSVGQSARWVWMIGTSKPGRGIARCPATDLGTA